MIEQRRSTGDPPRTGRDPVAVAAALVGLACIGAVAALVRWSLWWPHSDIRRLWATGLGWTSGIVGVATLAIALSRLTGRGRRLLAASVVVVTVAGFVGGFRVLEQLTAWAR